MEHVESEMKKIKAVQLPWKVEQFRGRNELEVEMLNLENQHLNPHAGYRDAATSETPNMLKISITNHISKYWFGDRDCGLS